MAKLSTAQKNLVLEALTYDKNSNYSGLELYLKQIVSGSNVTFKTRSDQPFVVPPSEAWEIIAEWGQSDQANLPLGDRGSPRARAARLLNYIQINLMGKTQEAAASYRLILEQANSPLVKPSETVSDPSGIILQKAYDLRREQIRQLQSGLIGKLATNLEKTQFLKNIPDAPTRALVMQMIAASNLNFRQASDFTPERINQLLLHEPGYKQLNNAIHLAYSRASQKDFVELENTVNSTISSVYEGNESKYLSDMHSLRELSELAPTLSDIDWMVNHLAFASSPAEKASLASSLRSTLVSSARSSHQTGESLLRSALKSAGLPDTALSSLSSLSPYLEEIEVKQRHLLLGTDVFDRDPRLLATAGLAQSLGVDLTTPWLKPQDLNAVAAKITQKHGVTTLVEAAAKAATPAELFEIKDLLSKTSDYNYYHTNLSGNLLLSAQEALAKTRGNLSSFAQPLTRFTTKVWAGYEKIDDLVHAPVRGLADWWETTTEKYPLLDPARFIFNKWTGFQVGIASRLNVWAARISGSGGWFSGFATHIADFTEGFVKNEANWSGAGFFFFERKWGNLLDWAAKKAGKESWTAVKGSVWKGLVNAIEVGGNKLAAGLGSKLATTLAGLASSSAGFGLIILAGQLGWELLKLGFGKIKQFFTDSRFREKVLNWLPITLGAGLTALLGLPALMLAGLGALGTGLLAFLAAIIGSLVSLFTLAAAWALAILASFALLYFIFKPTTELDSGLTQLVTNILCNDEDAQSTDKSAGSLNSKTLACANCLAKYLTECYGSSVSQQSLGKGIGCLLAKKVAPDVASLIERSTTSFTYLQCVGFVQASIACGGGSLQGANACSYEGKVDPNYEFVSGLKGAKPGDPVVFRSSGVCGDSAPGHIGILKQDAGALVCLVDANQKCSGCVSDNNCLPKTFLAGYLKKI